jgi:hypothetical protein
MPDIDAISNLRQRLAKFESDMTRIRTGKEPASPPDLLAWTAGTSALAARRRTAERLFDVFRRNLQEDWNGLHEAVAAWAARIDKRFPR